VRPAYAARARECNGRGRDVSELTELVAGMPAGALRRCSSSRWNTFQPRRWSFAMDPKHDNPNDELYVREPMRIVFALSALLLGLLAALH
jgi:hypothetical protein